MLGQYIHHTPHLKEQKQSLRPAAETGSAAVARSLEQPERHRTPDAELVHHILRNQRKPAVAAVLDADIPAGIEVGIAPAVVGVESLAAVEIARAPAWMSRIDAEFEIVG